MKLWDLNFMLEYNESHGGATIQFVVYLVITYMFHIFDFISHKTKLRLNSFLRRFLERNVAFLENINFMCPAIAF